MIVVKLMYENRTWTYRTSLKYRYFDGNGPYSVDYTRDEIINNFYQTISKEYDATYNMINSSKLMINDHLEQFEMLLLYNLNETFEFTHSSQFTFSDIEIYWHGQLYHPISRDVFYCEPWHNNKVK